MKPYCLCSICITHWKFLFSLIIENALLVHKRYQVKMFMISYEWSTQGTQFIASFQFIQSECSSICCVLYILLGLVLNSCNKSKWIGRPIEWRPVRVYGQIGSINSPTILKEIKTYRPIADHFYKFDTFFIFNNNSYS